MFEWRQWIIFAGRIVCYRAALSGNGGGLYVGFSKAHGRLHVWNCTFVNNTVLEDGAYLPARLWCLVSYFLCRAALAVIARWLLRSCQRCCCSWCRGRPVCQSLQPHRCPYQRLCVQRQHRTAGYALTHYRLSGGGSLYAQSLLDTHSVVTLRLQVLVVGWPL